MAGAYPDPKIAAFRGDGEGGLQLMVVAQDGGTQLLDVTPKRAAEYLAALSEYVARQFNAEVERRS